jgi:hypothetical protein
MSPGSKRPSPPERHRAAALARVFLMALAIALPFEAPVCRMGPLLLTSTEILLYVALAAWAIGRGLEEARRWRARAPASPGARPGWRGDRLGWAVATWLAVIVLAALAAPAYRGAALKHALRALGGGALFFAVRDLVRPAAQARALALALVAGALLSAAAAVVEAALPASAPLWRAFHERTFTALGLARPSGPFAYPTIAAMSWEAALPLAIGLAALAPARERQARRAILLAGGAAGLLGLGVLLSATRAALAGAALGALLLLALGWRAGPRLRAAATTALVMIAVLVVSALAPGGARSRLGLRLSWWRDGTWFSARYTVDERPLALRGGAVARVPLEVQNTGSLAWPRAGADAVHVSYHWESAGPAGPRLDFEGRRTPLPHDLAPGASLRLTAEVQAPRQPGRYRLRWDMVRENVTWFSERGNPTGDQLVDVSPPTGAPAPPAALLPSTLEDHVLAELPSRPELWAAALRLWRQHPLLGVGPDNFRRLHAAALAADRSRRGPPDPRLHANSLYFETLADTGLLGVASLLLLMAATASTLRARRAELLPLAAGVGAATFFVHGVLDTFLAFTPTYGLFWMLLGLTAAGRAASAAQAATGVAPDGAHGLQQDAAVQGQAP